MTFFRYPGGKTKLRTQIIDCLVKYSTNCSEYREPFFGGGSIGLSLINKQSPNTLWINDKDIGIFCLWTSVIKYPEQLKKRILEFTPSTDSFYSFKEILTNIHTTPEKEDDIVDIGFKKFAIHQISYSGLGTKSGGPLGGKKQASDYKIDCRWSPEYTIKRLNKIQTLFAGLKVSCTNVDFQELLVNVSSNVLVYLDPPYFDKGNSLYQCGFSMSDHERLASVLKNMTTPWVLSYDDVPEIRRYYEWATIETLEINYTISTSRKKTELLITP